jgi:hypothetical protein
MIRVKVKLSLGLSTKAPRLISTVEEMLHPILTSTLEKVCSEHHDLAILMWQGILVLIGWPDA